MNCVKRAFCSSSFKWRGRMCLSSSSSSSAAAAASEPQRPAEIPFQPKVANSLNFIGVVQSPLQFLASLDGNYWAATILSQPHPSRPPLSIPIVFQGDLAHTAASHLKPDDNVYISGHLTADKLPLSLSSDQHYFQVMVQSLNFVQGSPYSKSHLTSDTKDLKPYKSVTKRKALDPKFWEDLVNNLTEWRDFRIDKINEVVKEKHPDFKHKEDGRALWLDSAPSWVVEKLGRSEAHKKVGMAKKSLPRRDGEGSSGVESWKDLIQNPSKWWDNRADKPTKRHPDFKHKETGEGLWLNRAPQWAMDKFPLAKA
ncbi:hypothetical protein V2J09_017673 [Rumex salicifolius]